MSNECQNPQCQNLNLIFEIVLIRLDFELDIPFGWGLSVVFVKIVAGFFVIL